MSYYLPIKNNYKASKGFSLIEIMLAFVIGSMLIVFSLDLIFSNQRLKAISEDHSLVINNANRAMQLLSRSIRIAGYNNSTGSRLTPFYVGACDIHTACSFDGATLGDQIAVQYFSASGLDTAGNSIPAGELAVDIFYVANDPVTNINNLFCRGFNTTTGAYRGNAVVIAEGIDRLDIIYGVSQGSIYTNLYLSASEVIDWLAVTSVRVSLLARTTANSNIFNNQERTYIVPGASGVSYTDNIIRHLFSSTVDLLNVN